MSNRYETNEYFVVQELNEHHKDIIFRARETDVTVLWNTGELLDIIIGHGLYKLEKNQIIFVPGFRKIEHLNFKTARLLRFNHPFYCVAKEESTSSGRSLLSSIFSHLPVSDLDSHTLGGFEISWAACCAEIQEKSLFQKEMLQTIFKQMLILASRNYKLWGSFNQSESSQNHIVQQFNYLVEIHFAQHRDISFYASKLNKSPKTLANLFSALSDRAPLGIIHDRIVAQAKKLIDYSDQSITEIAYSLGYDDIQTFSRFFKNKEGLSPTQYREKSSNTFSLNAGIVMKSPVQRGDFGHEF